MLAIHVVWGPDGRLHLWAEDDLAYEAARAASAASAGSADRQAGASLAPHPFAASAAEIIDALGLAEPTAGESGASVAGDSQSGQLVLRLPASDGLPLPSPSLPVTPLEAPTPGPSDWLVPAVALAEGAAIRLLASPPEPLAERPDPTVRFAARLSRLGLEFVARGRVMPAVTEHGESVRWQPVPGAGDRARLRSLARSMPEAFRCAREFSPRATGSLSPDDVVEAAVAALVDAHVRELMAPVAARRLPLGPARDILEALTSSRPAVPAATPSKTLPGAVLATLERGLAAWRAHAQPAEGSLRTVFRLVEPGHGLEPERGAPGPERGAPEPDRDGRAPVAGDRSPVEILDEPWRLEVLSGPRDEPSLLVPAADVWRDRAVLARAAAGSDPEEVLLADLARASRLFPPLDSILEEARPAVMLLDTPGAHGFLRDGAPLLAEAGFGVMLPGWWSSRRRRLGLRMRARGTPTKARTTVGPVLGASALVEFELGVALGDSELSERELRALVKLKAPLVRVRGEWVEVRPDEIAAALRAVSASAGGGARSMTVADLLRASANGVAGLPVVDLQASGWLDRLLGAEAGRVEPMATPPGFSGELRPYQQRGLGWLAFLDSLGLGACLADDMGLGKTAQLLALLVSERAAGGGESAAGGSPDGEGATNGARPPATVAPTLVVCPMSVVGNWQREAARFAPGLRVLIHHGAGRAGEEDLATAAAESDVVITTYGLLARDEAALGAVNWGRVVLDEAQAVKNAETRQSRAARGIPAASHVALTGTPIENRLSELWSIMEFCNRGLLGTEHGFRDRFAIPIEQRSDPEATERLRRLTGPFILRRVKTDPSIVPELPRKLEMTVACNLTPEQASLYRAVVEDMLRTIEKAEGSRRRGLVLQAIGRLKQVCNHPAHYQADGSRLQGRSGKLAALEEILEDAVAAGDAALVFTQYTEWAERLVPHLRERLGREVLYLHGATARLERDRLVERFQAGLAPVFVLSLMAGGRGLNLTAANQVVHYDRWWNPAVEDQASDRAYRIGQLRDVQVRRLVCAGTIEERIAEMHEAKRGLASRVVGSGEGWLTELTTDELRELLALSPDAVAEA